MRQIGVGVALSGSISMPWDEFHVLLTDKH